MVYFLEKSWVILILVKVVPVVYGTLLNRQASKSYVGKTVEILCEGYDEKKKKFLGRDTYGRMAYFSGHDLIGKFVNVKITKAGGISLLGELVSVKG